MIVLTTERLIVRHLQEDDFDALYTLCSASEVMQYMGNGQLLTPQQVRDWIHTSQKNYQKHLYGCFAILSRQDGQFIGFGGLVHPYADARVEIIYAFKKSHWGQGLATEFARSMINTGFQDWRLPRIEATIDPQNSASLHVIQKLAMTYLHSGVDEHNLPTEFYAIDNPTSPIGHLGT